MLHSLPSFPLTKNKKIIKKCVWSLTVKNKASTENYISSVVNVSGLLNVHKTHGWTASLPKHIKYTELNQ